MNKNTFINYLKYKKIVILSPHLDDAILSMGMLSYLLKQYENISVINVFTKAHAGSYTFSGKQYLQSLGYTNAEQLYRQRIIEDKKALSSINAKQINFQFSDALFRRKKQISFIGKYIAEFNHIYPTYRWHVIKRFNPNDFAIAELQKKLMKTVPKDAIVFSPLGIGNHVDHVITHNVCRKIFQNVIYYADFPYNIRLDDFGKLPNDYQKFDLPINYTTKSKLTHCYESQIYGLFPGGILPQHKERFFVPKSFISKIKK
jgi:LmbE family N-acetylglucosaminyl deacetylase